MTGQSVTRVEALRAAGERAARERAEAMRPFWDATIAADARLAVLSDRPDWRAEVEARLSAWSAALDADDWVREWSRPEVVALSDRVRQLDEELASVINDVSALSRATAGGDLDHPVANVLLSLTVAFDALGPAVEAAQFIEALPEKRGGPGSYTANLRRKPIETFAEAMVPIFRAAGIPLGGNHSRDRAFDVFLEIASQHVTGAAISGKGALLAALRKL